ncbi:SDR family oxidoreductase [Saccharopolyspora phatthalungensis]|uniref:3-oxoacyl-[acyl-carrier protein] reductase n=1 Tax=Saccharopolyspora phatthalungensis TaxID=664693 RepID=A0A840QDL6_9PSEU|nr:SDR family oxidoreductase [Saccharopolyspora phatthalungensis]MBB5156748.1 3-oxoacyl-[acyl-carrier protein] reductase [Saccharopolyspora phatthalungensis]
MELGISGRNAFVCASTGGLGEATARALAAEGVNVVVSGRRGDRARAIAAELPGAVGIEVDLTAPDGADQLLAAATSALGDIDILVLNGPGPRPATASVLTIDDTTQAVHNLLLVHQRLVAGVLPGMRERGWGRVLAIGSSGVVAPIPRLALSNIGRSALAAYLKGLAAEVAADGVTANLLLPGRIATDRVASLDTAQAEREQRTPEEVRASTEAAIPAGRYGDPTEFGAAAAFLCSAKASYITGTAIRCDGGMVATL